MKAQCTSLDRIGNIPSSIIENILCLLPIKEAVRTSILSRNWRYNWTKIPKLVFNEYTFKESTCVNEASVLEETFDIPNQRNKMTRRCKMFYVIYQVLLSHQGPIHEFGLYLNGDVTYVEIDQIISHLVRQNTLKKFTLDLSTSWRYKLPLSIFSLHQLMDLSLVNCNIYLPPTKYQFRSHESLSLINVKTSTKTLLHLISCCPLLKSFSLLINFPNTLFDDTTTLIELFDCLLLVEHLIISSGAIQWFVKDGVPQKLPMSLVNLKCLCSEDMWFIDMCDLPFLVRLMRSSPNLEKLKLHIAPIEDISYWACNQGYVVTQEEYSNIRLEHLMDFEIDNFSNLKTELEFVKLMLAKSPMLKRLKIYLLDNVTKDEEMTLLRILLRTSRASPLVEIIVESVCYEN
ncbi:F-box/FBD/LRR-repeat protein [Tanacetum coccineum]